MINKDICGTYWAVRLTKDGSIPKTPDEKTYLWLVQGNEPTLLNSSTYRANYIDVSIDLLWLRLEEECYSIKRDKRINAEDFLDLKFPDIKVEDGPVQIEICKSGKVYYYE